MTQAPKHHTLWRSVESIPQPLVTDRFLLEPLCAAHAEVDFDALMSCRLRLREELQWGEWPPEDFTLELNRDDLRRHHNEFLRGEAFAYTVLNLDGTGCLGCIYLERCLEIDGAQLAYWVVDDAITMESLLVNTVLHWAHEEWELTKVLLPLRSANLRGLEIVKAYHLPAWIPPADSVLVDHICFLSTAS